MNDVSVALGAAAVIDEIDLLRAALHGATSKNCAGAQRIGLTSQEPLNAWSQDPSVQHLTPRDVEGIEGLWNAETVYGLQLKAWIDMQVDRRITVLHQGVIENRLAASEQLLEKRLAAVEAERCVAVGETHRFKMGLDAVKGTQARLVTVAQDISDELADIKLRTDRGSFAVERLTAFCEEIRVSASAKKCTAAFSQEQGNLVLKSLSSQEASLAEVRGLQEGLRDLHRNLTGRHDSHERNFSELHRLYVETREKHIELTLELRGTAETSKREATDLVQLFKQLEQTMLVLQAEISAEVASAVSRKASDSSGWELCLDALRQDVVLALKEGQQGLEDLRVDVATELGSVEKQMLDSFRKEAADVVALEQKLLTMREELDRRVDELFQSHRGCVATFSERFSNSPATRFTCMAPAESSSNRVISPRTRLRELADAPKPAWVG